MVYPFFVQTHSLRHDVLGVCLMGYSDLTILAALLIFCFTTSFPPLSHYFSDMFKWFSTVTHAHYHAHN